MKKLFIFFSAIILTFSITAQDFGVQAGLNITNIKNDIIVGEYAKTNKKGGINCGLNVIFPLTDVMFIKTGLLYSEKGALSENNGLNMSLAFTYMEFPINIAYSINNQISLIAGPYFGLLMRARSKVWGNTYFLEQPIDEEDYIKEDMPAWDFGINIGTSFSINESTALGAGYQVGLTDINNDRYVETTHSNIHIELTYFFKN
tara:strand:- start:525 stop:1133 length:609 start_codon:yes stop_codon:yes gene_type:complete